jgi:hypothetical protein
LTEAADPRTHRVVPPFNPRSDVWEIHFRWSSTGTKIIGRTSSGRATIVALRMNDSFRVIARVHWRRAGIQL